MTSRREHPEGTPPGAAPEQHTPGPLSEQQWDGLKRLCNYYTLNGPQPNQTDEWLLCRALLQRESELAALHAENEALREMLALLVRVHDEPPHIVGEVEWRQARALLRASVGES